MTQTFSGWRLTGLLSILLALMALGILITGGMSTDAIRMVIRATARTSLVLFLLTFIASPAVRLWPGSGTRWLLRNRRYIGVSFAASHGIHALAIIAFAIQDPVLFGEMTSTGTLISGGSAYLFIILMAATSFDRAVAMLGARNWRILHTTGAWYIALSFIVTNAKRTPDMPLYWLPVALVAVAILLRLVVMLHKRRSLRPA